MNHSPQSAPEVGTPNVAGKYLTIVLAEEAYGIPVLSVREIIRLPKITRVPQMPAEVSGVINLRGRVIAIVDLRVKFGLPATDGGRTCVIVVQVRLSAERVLQLGLIVDAVEEVVNVAAGDLEPTPEFGVKVDTAYLLGMAKVKGRVHILLDIHRVVTGEALATIDSLAR